MQRYRSVEVGLGGPKTQRQRRHLDDLGRPPSPSMWQPTTLPLSPSTSSFMKTRSSRPDSVAFIGRNDALKTSSFLQRSDARCSGSPTLASSGVANTAVGINVVLDHARLAAELGVGKSVPLADGNRRQGRPIRHIADGKMLSADDLNTH